MKKLTLLALSVLPILLFGQNATVDARSAAVLKVIREWDNAYAHRDSLMVRKYLAEDYVGIDHAGEVTTKADEVKLARSGEYVILSVEQIEPRKVRFYGSTAIVTSYSNVNLRIKGAPTNFVGRATTVCVEKKAGEWEIVSWHASKAKED